MSSALLGLESPLLLHLASIIGVLLALVLVSRILRSPREPAATIAWLALIVFLPIIGVPLYLAFGERKLDAALRRKAVIALPEHAGKHPHPVHSLLISLGMPASTTGNRVDFHADGRVAWRALFSLLETARRRIDIAIFILADDEVGKALLACLKQRAEQGVSVRLLLDGVGSFPLPKSRLRPLSDAGVEIAWFIPVIHRPLRGKTNLRNHRKIVIVDDTKAWTGGRNIAREYLGPDCPSDCWTDLSFTQQGPSVASYRAIFEADWCFANDRPAPDAIVLDDTADATEGRVQVVPSGPDIADDPIYAALLTASYEARQRLIAVTPYYIPDRGIQEALRLAALRGIEIDLILPARSNHRLADIARNRYLRELATAGARIWLLPTMTHAKAVVIDERLALAGSANLDIRSLFLNCEVVSLFYSDAEIRWLSDWLVALRERARRHHPPAVGATRELVEGLVELVAYQL